MILPIALTIAATCFGLALLLNLWSLFRADNPGDKILALDTMVVNIIALIVIYGIAFGTGVFFEAAMLFAMMGFVSTVAFCRYILRGNIIE
ncbi:MAG: K+/H+ antiporter subunit F [Alphaproteobacteria bacterium]|jgi:multicomponent K+:H+ antiporter subunit F|nr:K+/H+ antiporter subunit F [Alphaproteobacteria bacterium]